MQVHTFPFFLVIDDAPSFKNPQKKNIGSNLFRASFFFYSLLNETTINRADVRCKNIAVSSRFIRDHIKI